MTAVLFDLDGTLTDSLPLILHTYETVFREMGLDWQPQAVQDMIGLPLVQIARTFAGERDGEFLCTYQSLYFRDHDRLMRSYPWTDALLDALRGAGIRMGVVTAKGRRGTEKTLQWTGLAPYFEVVVTADDSPTHKPDPGPVRAALAAMDVAAAAAAYVGDSVYDVLAGKAAGTLTAAVTWGAAGRERLAACQPDAVFDDWRELTRFLGG